MTDQELIELIKKDKIHKATKSLYNYFPVVKKYVLANSGTKQDAEDVFQDALIIFYTKVNEENFKLNSSINTFLFSICKLKWFESLRKMKKENLVIIEDIGFENGADLNVYLEEDNKLKIVQAAFNSLGAKCKELLYRFYYLKESMVKIAKELSFADDKVAKNQKYRCIEKTKAYINQNN